MDKNHDFCLVPSCREFKKLHFYLEFCPINLISSFYRIFETKSVFLSGTLICFQECGCWISILCHLKMTLARNFCLVQICSFWSSLKYSWILCKKYVQFSVNHEKVSVRFLFWPLWGKCSLSFSFEYILLDMILVEANMISNRKRAQKSHMMILIWKRDNINTEPLTYQRVRAFGALNGNYSGPSATIYELSF